MISIRAVLAAALCAVLCPAPADSQSARADPDPRRIDIPAGDLNTALEYLSTRSGAGLVYRPDQVKGVKTRGVHGALSPEEAVKQLLEGTGLEVSTDSTRAMLIAAPQVIARNSPSDDDGTLWDEIIVTATKENMPARTIAGSVAVLPGSQLDASGAQSFADYLTRVPGVIFNAGPLQKRTFIAEPLDFKTTINNLRLDQDVGIATLTATATYHQKAQFSKFDLTALFGPLFGNQLSPIGGLQSASSNGTTFEMRLASKPGGRFDYVVGIMHDLTRESFLDLFGAPGAEQYATRTYDPIFGAGFGQRAAPGNIFYTAPLDVKGEEEALFGEGSFHFNDQWKITLGGRLFDTKVDGANSASGLLYYLLTTPQVLSFDFASAEKATGFTPKASITWNPTSNIMTYALASKGFRFGGPNINPPDPKAPFPPTYAPDSLWNYEIGTRTDWLDRTLELDATAFYIDWSNIQVRLATAGGLAYATNFGKAKNYGLESTVLWHPVGGWTMRGNVTYLDATLSQAVVSGATNEPAGATLPGASKWNLNATVRYDWSGIPLRPAVQLSDRFISTAPAGFGFVEPITVGNYNLLDARASGRYGNIEATVFVNNIADKRGVSTANDIASSPFSQYIVRPRTYGLTLDYRF